MRKNQKMCFYLLVGVFLTSVFLTAIFENSNFSENDQVAINLHESIGLKTSPWTNAQWHSDFNEYIETIAFSDDGNSVVAGIGNKVYIFSKNNKNDSYSAAIFKNWATNYQVESVAISANGSYIVAGSADDNLYLIDSSKDLPLWSSNLNNNDVSDVEISDDGNSIVACSGDNIFYFEDLNSTPVWIYNGTEQGVSIEAVEMSSDGRYISAGGSDLFLFNESSSTPLWNHTQGVGYVDCLKMSSDGNYTVIGAGVNIHLFNNSDYITPFEWTATVLDAIYSVDISSDGSYIVSGGYEKRIYLFNKSSTTPEWSYYTGDNIQAVAISGDGNYVTAGVTADYIYLFNRSVPEPIWNLPTYGQVGAVAISNDGAYVAAGTLDGDFYIIGITIIPPSGGPDPIQVVIIIIIVGSVISVSVASTYTIVTKQKEKKEFQRKALSKLKHKPKGIGKIIPGKEAIDNKIDRTKAKPIDPATLTPIPKGTTEGYKKKKKAPKLIPRETSEDKVKALKEIAETRSEMAIQENIDLCLVHKGRIEGINYTCPKCQAKYCLKCATHLAKNDKICWVCDEPISIGIEDNNIGNDLKKEQGKDYLKIFNDENGLEKLKNLENINITAVSSEFLNEIKNFNWDDEDREEFIKEMGSLSPKMRKEFLEEMKKNSEFRDINK